MTGFELLRRYESVEKFAEMVISLVETHKTAEELTEHLKKELPEDALQQLKDGVAQEGYPIFFSDMMKDKKILDSSEVIKAIGIIIPEGCRQLYVFDNKEHFQELVKSGRMIPLYEISEGDKTFIPVYIAYKAT